MFSKRDFLNSLPSLERSVSLRQSDDRVLKILKRLYLIGSHRPPHVSQIPWLKLSRHLTLRLPNLLDEKVGNRDKIEFVRTQIGEQPISNMDHKGLLESWSFLQDFNLPRKIRGLNYLSGEVLEIRNLLAEYLRSKVRAAGYHEILTPSLVSWEDLKNTGQFPRFKDEDLFKLDNSMYLSPTGEVQLGNLSFKSTVKLASFNKCFRNEVNYGKGSKGLIRNLEFEKLELYIYCKPKESEDMIRDMLKLTNSILQELDLTYRVNLLAARELASSSALTYDLEVWLPVSDFYLEVSSISNCLDWQSSRSGLYWREKMGRFRPHTLNGSCFPLGRLMVCLSERYQDPKKILELLRSLRSKGI